MSCNSQFEGRFYAIALLALGICLPAAAQSGNDAEFQELLKEGFALHQEARFAQAIPVLEQARHLEPDDYFANLLLGIDLMRTGKAADALPHLKLAARSRPGEELPEEYLGEAEASRGKYAQAAQAFLQAVERGRGSEQSLEAWGGFALERFRQIGENLRANEAGIATVRRLVEAAAKPPASLVCEGSIPVLEQKLALHPAGILSGEVMESAYKLSICYAVEAGKAAVQLQDGGEDVAALHRLRGDVLLRLKGDPVAAEQEYRQAITMQPGDPGLKERLAEAQLTAGDTEGARQSALEALAVDPQNRDALRTLASLAMSSRNYEQAVPWLRRLDAESPEDRAVQVQLGKALAQTGNSAEALKFLVPALTAGYPDEKGSLHALEARVLHELGRDAEATRAAAEARRLSDAFQAGNKNQGRQNPDENQ